MQLFEYLHKTKTKRCAFAEKIGVSHVSLRGYIDGKTMPSKKTLQKIADATNGQVMPNDFLQETFKSESFISEKKSQ